ncbi:MAG: sulfur oxidation protein SoxY [Burkholderiales bacterium]|nr:sulfur oxidation protein SoxY [Burkholderiales bacterium]
MPRPHRRRFLVTLAALGLLPRAGVRPAGAAENDLAPIIAKITSGKALQPGRVRIETPLLADNGHSVPVRLTVESPMSAADHVSTISLLSDRNPRPVIATYHLGPRAGRARIATRVRLNGTQRIWAIARMSDGSCWSGHADIVVTESACLDGS